MTGREGGADLAPIGRSPVVILVRPQLADNIGAVARAMANGGLFHLRLVAPRDGWPQERAWRMASGADRILDAATLHDTVPDAVADLHHVLATCPRPRHIVKPVLTARGAAAELRAICARPQLCAGILFGPERAGLDNDDMACADALVRFPLNPAFMSLNLAQAVMVLAYEWWTASEQTVPRRLMTNESRIATKGELENFLRHLVAELDASGFLDNLPKRPGMLRNLRHFFERGEATEQELRTLHGVVTELARGRRQRGRPDEPALPPPAASAVVLTQAGLDPDWTAAEIDVHRLVAYILSPEHPRGRDKARWFRAALGIGPGEADSLAAQITADVVKRLAVARDADQYGRRFSVDVLVEGPQGIAYVRTGWIVQHGSRIPRLTSAYGRRANAVRSV